jgi:hypothetical protein
VHADESVANAKKPLTMYFGPHDVFLAIWNLYADKLFYCSFLPQLQLSRLHSNPFWIIKVIFRLKVVSHLFLQVLARIL